MYLFLEEVAPTAGLGGMLIPLVLVFGIMYFVMIRPENKRKKEAEQMRSSVKVGDKITTIGGIIGTICHIKDDKIVIETSADRVRIELNKWAISSNDTANERAKAEAQKVAEARRRAKEEKKAAKDKR